MEAAGREVRRDPDATSEFQRVARAVTLMRERRDPALTAFIAAHGFGVSRQELEAMGLPHSAPLFDEGTLTQ